VNTQLSNEIIVRGIESVGGRPRQNLCLRGSLRMNLAFARAARHEHAAIIRDTLIDLSALSQAIVCAMRIGHLEVDVPSGRQIEDASLAVPRVPIHQQATVHVRSRCALAFASETPGLQKRAAWRFRHDIEPSCRSWRSVAAQFLRIQFLFDAAISHCR
jgi:hypothetical protein